MMTTTITTERLRELMDYRDGSLYWKHSPRNGWEGKPVGFKSKEGYLITRVNGKLCKVHRLVWLWHGNELPKMLDHINGVRHDNRIENLRPCLDAENARNRKLDVKNSTGYANVVWNKANQNYNVQIRVDGKKKHIGAFDNVELAALVAEEARHKFFGEFARKGA
jgi:hypothetical protein